jgi:NAD(P)-dependent dehydrogenase (short-subunit alcohol dehydrogenase family)
VAPVTALPDRVVSHYVNNLALQLAPGSIRVNAVHPTNVNTDMLHSRPMYAAFRPDLENPTREDAEATSFHQRHAGSICRA